MRLALAVLLALINASPLRAQQGAAPSAPTIDCPFEGVSLEQRMLAASAGSARLTDAPEDGEERGGVALDAILANVPRCAEAGRWSESQRQLALHYLLAQLGREDMLRRYAAQNVDLSFIDTALAATPAGSQPPFAEFEARIRAQGIGDDRPDSPGDIAYIYMMLVYQAEMIRAGFTDPNFRNPF